MRLGIPRLEAECSLGFKSSLSAMRARPVVCGERKRRHGEARARCCKAGLGLPCPREKRLRTLKGRQQLTGVIRWSGNLSCLTAQIEVIRFRTCGRRLLEHRAFG